MSTHGLKVKFAYPFAAVWPTLIKIIVKKSNATTVSRLLVKSVAGQRQMMTNGATANTNMTNVMKMPSNANPVMAGHLLPFLELPPVQEFS